MTRSKATESTAASADLATVARALKVLILIADDRPMGVTEIGAKLGYPKAVAHRIAATLVSYGFLEQDRVSKRYRVGPQAFRVGQTFDVAAYANEITEDLLQQLALEHGYSTYVAVLDDMDTLIVGAYPGRSAVRVESARKGDRRSAYSTAVGKALLSVLPPSKMAEIVNRMVFQMRTERTIVDKSALMREIELTRARGYALSDQESILEVTSVGVPILGLDERSPIAISISIPSFINSDEKLRELVELMRRTSNEIQNKINQAKLEH